MCFVKQKRTKGTAAEILHREWCWRVHVQRGAEASRKRDVHQVRPQQRGRDSRARLSVQNDAQDVVEGIWEDRTGPGEEGTRPPAFSVGQMQSAVSCFLEHGRGLSRMSQAMGFEVECDGLRKSMSRKGCSLTTLGWGTYVLKRITTPRPHAGRGYEGILRVLREGPRIRSGGHAGSIEIWNHPVHYIDRGQCARKACGIPPQVMEAGRAREEPCIARACAGGETEAFRESTIRRDMPEDNPDVGSTSPRLDYRFAMTGSF